MPDYAGNIPDGGFALQPLSARSREERGHPMRYLPELHITLGKDDKSAGLTITVWTGTGGQYPGYRTLYAVRWRDAAHDYSTASTTGSPGVKGRAGLGQFDDSVEEIIFGQGLVQDRCGGSKRE